jgi:response regulator RpfG family c-di-GMP phosphodiesterase
MTLKLLLAGKEKADFLPIKMAFENTEATIIVATSMALALFLARKNLPDLVIVQQHLTDSAGYGLYHEFKNEQELDRIPFVFLNTDNEIKANQEGNNQVKNDSPPVGVHFLQLDRNVESAKSLLLLKEKILALAKNAH